jgi:hypothetical protein
MTSNDLIETKWGAKRQIGCVETYEFISENEFEYYNCEMELTRTGSYSVIQDTLTVLVYHVDNTPSFAGGTGKLNLRFQYNFLLRDKALEMIYFKDFKYSSEQKIANITYTRIVDEKHTTTSDK